MVQIQKRFEDNELNIGSSGFYVGAGWRQVMITGIELVDSFMDGKPQDLLITGVVTEGDFIHTEVSTRLSINDETLTPSGKISFAKMAHISLKSISIAAGQPSIPYTNLDILKGKKINVKFVEKQGKQKQDANGNPQYTADGQPDLYATTSQARDYKAIPQVAGTPEPAQPPVMTAPVPQAVQPAAIAPQPAQPQPVQQPMHAAVASDRIPF